MARVALVCEPPDGGVAEHVVQLALGLEAHGHEAVVFGPPAFSPRDRLAAAGRAFHELDLRRDYAHPHRDFAVVAPLARALRAGGFALVHAHAAKAGVVARLAARRTGHPAVYTPHCFPFVGDVSPVRRRFSSAVERALAARTAAIICVCEDERREALAHGIGRTELEVVYNGCPADNVTVSSDAALLALREGGSTVGAVSVLRRQKSLEVLIRATLRIVAAVPEARVVIVGEGPERPFLEQCARNIGLDRDDRFAFLPYAGPPTRYLHALDLYVLPSAWEAFPIGVLEAQACGVPQVASDVGGVREAVVPATGTLVRPGDPDRLADAVIELLRDPERRAAMASASRSRHAELFTVDRMVAGTAAVYDKVLSNSPPVGGRLR